MQFLRVGGALVLMVLPGGWIVLWGPVSRTLPASGRVLLAVLLSPLVVAAEFYALRLAGVPFAAVAILLPLLNLPAAWPLWQAARIMPRQDVRTVITWMAALAVPAAYLWYWMHDAAVRANWGHAWSHADISYMIANGQLRPEDPQLAGVGLAYPWIGHVHQAIAAYLLGTSPNVAYLWTNVALLAGTIGITALLTGEMGGSRAARAMSAIWLTFGINLAFVAWWVLPADTIARLPNVWGDGRFSPWIRKFGVFEPTVFGISFCAALLYVLARPAGQLSRWETPVLVGVLVAGLGVTYPVLLPAGLAGVAVWVVASTVVPWLRSKFRRELLAINVRALTNTALSVVVAVALVTLYLRVVMADRGSADPVQLSTLYEAKEKALGVVLVTLPLVLGIILGLRKAFAHPHTALMLIGTAAACAVLNVVFDVRPDRNEYKYIFVLAMALVPLASLGFANFAERFGRVGTLAVALMALIVVTPGFYRRYREIADGSPPMDVRSDQFAFRLPIDDRYAPALDAVRQESPVNAVLMSRRGDIDLTTVSGRATLVPADSGEAHGFGQRADHLLKRIRAYPAEIVDERRRMLFTVLDSSASEASLTLDKLLVEMKRPLVLVLENSDSMVGSWLPGRPDARMMFEGQGIRAWIVSPRPTLGSR